jgi:AcrR family transcriptional regulator
LIEARRAQILDAAAQVFARRGFGRATTKEIARTAGISEGTIYNYFSGKEDLLFSLMEHLVETMRFEELFEEALSQDPRAFLVSIYSYRQEIVSEHWALFQAILSEVMINRELGQRYYLEIVVPAMNSLEAYVEAQVGAGRIRPVNVSLFVRLLLAINVGMFLGFFLGEPLLSVESDDWLEELADLLFEGINPAGEERA